MIRLNTLAPAKINLTLRVLGKRADGFHNLASVVAFADAADQLSLFGGDGLLLEVEGPFAEQTGPTESNLVLKAARHLQASIPRLQAGRFILTKNLPVGAGLGGGSSDAAAALRLLAEANGLGIGDMRVLAAAAATGSDVSVCLDAQARLMHGRGEILSEPLDLPPLPAVLVFPGRPLATAPVFAAFDPALISRRSNYSMDEIPREFDALLEFLKSEPNDLEAAARKLVPEIGIAIELLQQTNPALARMSGSGSAVFALYETQDAARAAAAKIRSGKPGWWVYAVTLR